MIWFPVVVILLGSHTACLDKITALALIRRAFFFFEPNDFLGARDFGDKPMLTFLSVVLLSNNPPRLGVPVKERS